MLVTIDSDDAFAVAIYPIPVASAPGVPETAPDTFEREAEPPEGVPLARIRPAVALRAARRRFPRPGLAPHDSLAVRGWKFWKD